MTRDENSESTSLIVELETERLRLSEIVDADAIDVFSIFGSAKTMAFYDVETITELAQAKSLIASWADRASSGQGLRWGIRLRETDELIGTCGFNVWSPRMRSATLGYDLREDHWGKGYASEAVSRILEAGFGGELPCGPLHRIQADTVPRNERSESLLRKLGFVEEGMRREAGYWKGRFHDLKCFGLLEPEFCPVQPRT